MLLSGKPEYSDEYLMQLIREGDERAFSVLYDRYWDRLYTRAYHRLSDEIEAEEVVQDVFLSIWARRAQLEVRSSAGSYLSVAVKYQIINKLAKRKRVSSFKESFVKSITVSENTTDLWLSEKELRERLEIHINELPDKCRLVFKMSREEGLNAKQISEELCLAEKTIEAHITKALKILRSALPSVITVLFYLLLKK